MSPSPHLTGLLLLLFALPGLAAPRVLHFAFEGSADSPRGRSAAFFAQRINERFPGELHIETHPDAGLFDDATAIRELRFDTGAMEPPKRAGGRTPDRLYNGLMTAVDLGMAARWARPLTVFELPYLIKDMNAAHRLIDSPLFAELTEPLPRSGFMPLTIWDGGMQNVAVQNLRSTGPETLRGRRLKTSNSGAAQLLADTLDAVNGDTHSNAWIGNWWQLGRQNTDLNVSVITTAHAYQGFIVLINMDFWEALTPRLQAGLKSAIAETNAVNRRYAAVAEARAREDFATRFNADHIIEPQDLDAWKTATAPVLRHLRRRVGDALFDRVAEFLNGTDPD
ncbi:MAG: hypothetical protein KDI42_07825 [Gammaproteobacteria bacterium]|nr:hypothetical protein [Gammaproteobacteria bacterium]